MNVDIMSLGTTCPKCGFIHTDPDDNLPTSALEGLRKLRLYHWQMVLTHRRFGYDFSDVANKLADYHIKQVQLLNIFFPVGDTAEQDALNSI